jgi:hypothetical protein
MKKQQTKQKTQTQFWVVMKMQDWDSLSVLGTSLFPPEGGPCKFIPVFNTKKEAIAFDNGSRLHIRKIETKGY